MVGCSTAAAQHSSPHLTAAGKQQQQVARGMAGGSRMPVAAGDLQEREFVLCAGATAGASKKWKNAARQRHTGALLPNWPGTGRGGSGMQAQQFGIGLLLMPAGTTA